MLISTEGIILRTTRYGDSGLIVNIYTRSEGLVPFSFRMKQGKPGSKALLSPMTMVRLVADLKTSRKIHHTRELSLLKPYQSIPWDPVKGGVLMFINELMIKVLKEEEANSELFSFIIRVLSTLDEQQPLHPSYHLSVMVHLAKYLGFYPRNGNFQPGKCFDLREGIFVNPPVPHPEYADQELSILINDLISIPFDEYQHFRVERAQRQALLETLILFYHLHVAGFGQMKSVQVLRSMFD
ncbi:MAG: DNA repair protein RecO [Bacteroidales bacterium]